MSHYKILWLVIYAWLVNLPRYDEVCPIGHYKLRQVLLWAGIISIIVSQEGVAKDIGQLFSVYTANPLEQIVCILYSTKPTL